MKLETIHLVRAYEEWQGTADYDLSTEASSYQEAITQLATIFARDYSDFPHHGTIDYFIYYKTTLLVDGQQLEFQSQKIHQDHHPYQQAISIKSHPVYLEIKDLKRKLEEEQQELEDAKLKEERYQQELLVYHKIKAQLEKDGQRTSES